MNGPQHPPRSARRRSAVHYAMVGCIVCGAGIIAVGAMIAGHRQFEHVGVSVAVTGLLLSSIGIAFRGKSPSSAQVQPGSFRWLFRAVIACVVGLIAVWAFAFGAMRLYECVGELRVQSIKNQPAATERPAAPFREACFVAGLSLILATACSFAFTGIWRELQRPKAE